MRLRTLRWSLGLVSSLTLPLSLTHCGKENDKDGSKNPESTKEGAVDSDTSLLLDDSQLTGDHIANTVDEAIGAMIEGSESTGATDGGEGLALTAPDRKAKVERFRECKADETGTKAVVTIRRSLNRDRSQDRRQKKSESVIKHLSEKTRTWSKDQGTVACAANGKAPDIKRADLQGIALKSTFTNQREQSSSTTNEKKGTTVTMSRKFQSSGTRTVKWTEVKVEQDKLLLTKEVSSESSRSFDSLNKKGETKSFSQSVKTDPAAPLVIKIEREATSETLLSRTIVSGKKIATLKSGGRLETVFSNVKYVAGEGCDAASGTISGSIFAKDATEATATFTIDFANDASNVTIVKADGTKVETDFVSDGCEIEGLEVETVAGALEDKPKKDDVKLPS